jgi:hypothetical protein
LIDIEAGAHQREGVYMEDVDIIANSQTESVLAALDRGGADDKIRDRVSAALLRALTSVIKELGEIKSNLWQPEELRKFIDERHDRRCQDCPAKKWADTQSTVQLLQAQQAAQAAQTAKPAAQAAKPAAQAQPAKPEGGFQWVVYLMGNSSFQFFVLLLFLIGAFVYLTTGRGGVDAATDSVRTVIRGGVK